MESLIRVSNLSLKYKFVNSTSAKNFVLGKITRKFKSKTREKVALNNVSFDVFKGETLGIIGGNGAGKSTLLRVLSGVYEADEGQVHTSTDSIALLGLGTGFVNQLSGYENIYLNGLLLHMSKRELDGSIDRIIDFAGIRESIYDPVSTYSSGMKARLAFSIASQIDPDVLLIDEVLGVGDKEFKEKSLKRINDLITQNRTVILVSHSMETIKKYCNRVIWLEKGNTVMIGNTDEVLEAYMGGR